MGATTQKSIKNIIDSKYSFSHPKSNCPLQISIWKFTDEQLDNMAPLEGTPLKWPFKFYSDEGYIMALIQNRAKEESQDKKGTKYEPWALLKELKATLNLMEILYSFCNAEIEEYFYERILIESENKYLKDKLNLWIYVYAGQNLASVAKLKLLSHAIALERYISRGGLCSISKLYHQFQSIVDVFHELRMDSEQAKVREEDYYVAISSLAEDKIKSAGDDNKQTEQQILKGLWDQFQKYSLLTKTIFSQYLEVESSFLNLIGEKNSHYPKVDGEMWAKHKQLVLADEKGKDKGREKKGTETAKQKQADLNDSSPFLCEITQINFKEKKKEGFMNEQSNLIGELSVLNQKKGTEFFKIVCPEDNYLILTNYSSLRQYKQILELNVRLVINLAPTFCFNYYLNDLEYLHYYLAALPNKQPANAVLFENNIEHLLIPVTHNIINHTMTNKPKDPLNNYILIHSQGSLFSDENCTVVIGYLIVRYLYTYEKAFNLLSHSYTQYKGDKLTKLSIHKLYVDQLLNLEGRVLITSSPDYGVSLNHTFWRAYQVSNNHSSPGQTLIPRFIGQLSNPSQLTSLPNNSHHFYIVLSNQLAATLSAIIERWQKDPGMKVPGGVTGIKVLVGKQFEFRDIYVAESKNMIPLILKYELINRNKCQKSYNNEFLFNFIQDLVRANLQVESIEKSFRKGTPFNPLYSGFEEETPIGPNPKIPLPHNPKEKLTFKYPFLRPVWEGLKDDEYYFIVQMTKGGASVQIVKGKNWAGYEVDKQQFFARIVECYLKNIDEDKIWIAQEGEQSLFGEELNL